MIKPEMLQKGDMMNNFNIEKLNELIVNYKKDFDSFIDDEIYKWEAIKYFKSNWDLNVDDIELANMIKNSFKKAGNILTSYNYYPLRMIVQFANKEPQIVREMFDKLYNEKIDLYDRISFFVNKSQEFIEKYFSGKNHFQNMHAISTYLGFMYPDKYYVYKALVDKKALKYIDIEINDSDRIKTLINYFNVSDDLYNYLKEDLELINLINNKLNDECYKDDNNHIMIWDILYYAGKKYLDEETKKELCWLYSPGENASKWEECINEGVMLLGFDELGNLKQYENSSELNEALKDIYNKDNPMNDKCACDDFVNRMNIGDIIIAKVGSKGLLGYGVVESDYFFDDKRENYKHVRKVKWIKTGRWVNTIVGNALKTLTEISQYKGYPEQLLDIINGDGKNMNKNYYCLVSNPKIWSFSSIKIGDSIEYTSINDEGHKRRIYKNFVDIKKGDIVIAYESAPTKEIIGFYTVEEELKDNKVKFKKTEQLANTIPYSQLLENEFLAESELLSNRFQGSLFKLTSEEFEIINDMIREVNPLIEKTYEKYSMSDFYNDVYISEEKYNEITSVLNRKKNIILQGAPGVGKTFMAKRLAYSIIGEKNIDRVKMIQFHQNYSYEDFIEGIRPDADGKFMLEKGIFYNYCKKAESDPNHNYYLIIDEINRGNLSKIFGELLMLIENDKRGEQLTLSYSKMTFTVPENLYIIGMMNTADRSLAIMDYALRRRFSFIDVEPAFDNKNFKKYQTKLNNEYFNKIIDKIKKLNIDIKEDSSLGEGFMIGHSYFCNLENPTNEEIRNIIKFEIIPMLKEYWFDEENKVREYKDYLLGD